MTAAVFAVVPSPVGDLTLTGRLRGEGTALTGCWFAGHGGTGPPTGGLVRDDGAFVDAAEQLDAYFAGRRHRFDLPMAPPGTDFQQRVWSQLREIPYGETRSYGQLAESLGQPGAARAVGLANGANPLSIVVPCHRVIGADGSLTGFGGGIDRKRFLLDLEQGTPALL